MYGKCARNITHVPNMCLAETCQANGSYPFNVPDMFPPISRGPRPQCGWSAKEYRVSITIKHHRDTPTSSVLLVRGI